MKTKAELESENAQLRARLAGREDAEARLGADLIPDRLPKNWKTYTVAAIIVILLLIGALELWEFAHGTGTSEAAGHKDGLHQALSRVLVALLVAWLATPLSLFLMEVAYAKFTVRDEFMSLVREGKASCLSMAVFSVGTCIYAGIIFFAVLTAMRG